MYRGDLKPDLEITLTDDRTPVNLTTAASIRVIGTRNGTVAFDRAATGNTAGVIVMPWQTGDTSTVGRISVEVEVTWPGAKPQTFRPTSVVDILTDYA